MQIGVFGIFITAGLLASSTSVAANSTVQPAQSAPVATSIADEAAASRFAMFTPTASPIRHRIDYEVWDYALKNIVISMGPSDRSVPVAPIPPSGTRIRQGHNSRYRLEGSMVGFSFLDSEVISSLTEYREDLERVANTLDIASLPRNEQLAFWLNLHNVAMVERIALEWPVRQPREIEINGVTLDDAKFITVAGVAMSPRDIRENVVFANWRNPKVIYGFWRGEIGGPALEREAFTGANVSSLLDIAATDFVNSLRGTQKRGDRLDISTLYDETRPYYFPNFETDVRQHIAEYADADVTDILARTTLVRASIREWDIADLSGGSRGANYLRYSRPGITPGMEQLLNQRERKLEVMRRRERPTGQVIFSNIDLPGDPPNKNAVE